MQAIEMHARVTKGREIRLKLPENIQHGTVKIIVLYDEAATHDPVMTKRQFGQFKGRIQISDDLAFYRALGRRFNGG